MLINILFSVLYSINLAKKELQSSPIKKNLEIIVDQTDFERKKFPLTIKDISDLQKIFQGEGEVLFFSDNRIQMLSENEGFINLNLRFTTAFVPGEYYATDLVESVIRDDKYTPYDENYFIDKLRKDLRSGTLKRVDSVSPEFLLRHQIKYPGLTFPGESINFEENLLLLPLETYIDDEVFKSFRRIIVVYFTKRDYYAKGVIEAVKLLENRYEKELNFRYLSGIMKFKEMIEGLAAQAAVLATLTGGILVLIILGLGGIVTSILKRHTRDIAIRLCLGVDRYLIYFEALLGGIIPGIVGGFIGVMLSSYLLSNINLGTFKIVNTPWLSFLSFSFAFLIGIVAEIIPLKNLSKVEPLQILKEEN